MHDQAEDRCHRIGQHDAVTAWYLLAAETIDETMIELIARKRGIVGAVTDGRRDESEALVQSVVRERCAAAAAPPARRLAAAAGGRARGFRPPGERPQGEPGPLGRRVAVAPAGFAPWANTRKGTRPPGPAFPYRQRLTWASSAESTAPEITHVWPSRTHWRAARPSPVRRCRTPSASGGPATIV